MIINSVVYMCVLDLANFYYHILNIAQYKMLQLYFGKKNVYI